VFEKTLYQLSVLRENAEKYGIGQRKRNNLIFYKDFMVLYSVMIATV
jgi:hypothetical protein